MLKRLLLLSLLVPSLANSADSNGAFTVLSLGTKSCGTVVSDFNKGDWGKLTNSIWVAGYLTAINEHTFRGKNVAGSTDPDSWDLWIYNYCSQNPLDNLYKAASALYMELKSKAR